jgi:hypothetical protein
MVMSASFVLHKMLFGIESCRLVEETIKSEEITEPVNVSVNLELSLANSGLSFAIQSVLHCTSPIQNLRRHGIIEDYVHPTFVDGFYRCSPFGDGSEMMIEKGEIKRLEVN